MRCFDLGEAVGGGVWRHVIGDDPDDVWRRGVARHGNEEAAEEAKHLP